MRMFEHGYLRVPLVETSMLLIVIYATVDVN